MLILDLSVVWTYNLASGSKAGRAQVTGTHGHVFLPPQLFNDAIRLAVSYKQNSQDFMDEVLQELEVGQAPVLGGIPKRLLFREHGA